MNGNHDPLGTAREPNTNLEISAVSEARTASRAAQDEAFEALLVAAARTLQKAAPPRRGTNGE